MPVRRVPHAYSRIPNLSLSSSISLPVTFTAYMPGTLFSASVRTSIIDQEECQPTIWRGVRGESVRTNPLPLSDPAFLWLRHCDHAVEYGSGALRYAAAVGLHLDAGEGRRKRELADGDEEATSRRRRRLDRLARPGVLTSNRSPQLGQPCVTNSRALWTN